MINLIKEQVWKNLKHEFLTKNLEFAPIRDKQIDCLVEILKNVGLEDSEIVSIATSTILVQVGLDTHDLIHAENSDSLLDRQLRILGGDLASGYFYKILAEINSSSLIVGIAEGIKEINVLKVKKLQSEKSDEIAALTYELDTKLICKIIENFGNLEANKVILNQHF